MIWSIDKLDCHVAEDNLVITAHWALTEEALVQRGSQNVFFAPVTSYTPFKDLTEDQVLNWVWSVMGDDYKAQLEQELLARVESAKNPPVVSLAPPWLTN